MSRMKLRVCTWNVGNAAPPADLSAWLGSGSTYDIIVVGGQEANFSVESEKGENTADGIQDSRGMSNRGLSRRIKAQFVGGLDSEKSRNTEASTSRSQDLEIGSSESYSMSQSSIEEYRHALMDRLGLIEQHSHCKPSSSESSRSTSSGSLLSPVLRRMQPWQDDDAGHDAIMNTSPGLDKERRNLSTLSLSQLRTPSSRRRFRNKIGGKLGSLSSQRRARKGNAEREFLSANASSPSNSSEYVNAKRFSKRIARALGDEYVLIAKHHLMEIKLLVFVHQRIKHRVLRAKTTSEATGLGSVVGNKGGVAMKLTIDDTRFCFVSSHLAAHEGEKFLKDRNDDVTNIMRNLAKTKYVNLPAVHQFDHLIWLGDLNYRLDVERFHPNASGWDREKQLQYVHEQIQQEKYDELCKLDELKHEMAAMSVFGDFQEAPITFAPTFKTVRNIETVEYQNLRIPSYCDRILWHSLPHHRVHLQFKEYKAVPSISTSDHKPVYATFNLFVPNASKFYFMPAPSNAVKCTIDIHSLKLIGLYEKESPLENDSFSVDDLYEQNSNTTSFEDSTVFSPPNRRALTFRLDETRAGTKRTVRVEFTVDRLAAKKNKSYRAEVPLRDGYIRECIYDELPAIALLPLAGITELTYKYVTIVFSRMGTRQGASCVLPLAKLVQAHGNRAKVTLDLTKYGGKIAQVELDAELVASLQFWITSNNKMVKLKGLRKR